MAKKYHDIQEVIDKGKDCYINWINVALVNYRLPDKAGRLCFWLHLSVCLSDCLYVCLCVCLCNCYQDISRMGDWIIIKLSGYCYLVSGTN